MCLFKRIVAALTQARPAAAGQAGAVWAGEQPHFDDLQHPQGAAVQAQQVQAQAREAMQNYAFNDEVVGAALAASTPQRPPLSRAQVRAEAAEAMRTRQLRVGDGQ